ncbi:hypothetical protein H5410_052623 [Solanum commersonii]|uniref:Reverse transcriptase n=1 Tax=Solanum commersonii TaxID=4109 RepID=A0A9J5X3X3_SOLCO|nr:hypothetical protein H5410_052623 [Solanum commersonii]
MLNELPVLIIEKKNKELQGLPSREEVQRVVMGLNNDSADRPDGMTWAFIKIHRKSLDRIYIKWSELSWKGGSHKLNHLAFTDDMIILYKEEVAPFLTKGSDNPYYQHMLQRIGSKIQSWKGKLLSFSGRAILIKHVLQSMPIHCLSVMNPPVNVLNQV